MENEPQQQQAAPPQQEYVAEVFSKQLARKMHRPEPAGAPMSNMAATNVAAANAAPGARGGAGGGGGSWPRQVYQPPRRGPTDTLFRWNALPNEYIVPIGAGAAEPILGGSVVKWKARGVLRFPSSVQRIVFRTDNISSENQGVMVEGWACWRVSEPALAVQKLDFSDPADPMAQTNKILGIECAGIMKGLISVKSVNDLLKRREDLIDKLRDKLKPTEARWGISFDELGVSEVQVLSQDVFENMQRPFRNEAREVASTSDLDTEERIARKTATQREGVVAIEAESQKRLSETRSKSQSEIKEIEIAEEKRRILAEQEVKNLRLEEDKRVQSLQRKLTRELEREARQAEQEKTLAELAAREERALAEVKAKEARELEALRLAAERELAATESERQLREVARERALLQIETDREVAKAEAERTREAQAAADAAARLAVELESAVARERLAASRERWAARLDARERQRTIDGAVTEAELRARLIEALPDVAARVPVGDVRWIGGGGGGGAAGGDGPPAILGRAIAAVFAACEAFGLEPRELLGRRAGAAAGAEASASASAADE